MDDDDQNCKYKLENAKPRMNEDADIGSFSDEYPSIFSDFDGNGDETLTVSEKNNTEGAVLSTYEVSDELGINVAEFDLSDLCCFRESMAELSPDMRRLNL
ncbi:hypothetical protein Tsp_10248 [Trichinella spiralis]|uniref:hypothetical protein n=1 Tax=Trichinella spiralis TaxID=6334 RepID=UPI0001EFDFB5|nr:hypothetical protein Tsp_10248 [Trichinella spiralis]